MKRGEKGKEKVTESPPAGARRAKKGEQRAATKGAGGRAEEGREKGPTAAGGTIKLTVGGRRLEDVRPYDDYATLTELLALAKQVPPEYLALQEGEVRDGATLETVELGRRLAGAGWDEVLEQLPELAATFPQVSRTDMVLEWIDRHATDPEGVYDEDKLPLSALQNLSPAFATAESVQAELAEKRARDLERLQALSQAVRLRTVEIFVRLDNQGVQPLTLTAAGGVEGVFLVDVPDRASLIEIFDALEASREVPLLIYVDRRQARFFKVWRGLEELDPRWLKLKAEGDEEVDGIHMRVLNIEPGQKRFRAQLAPYYARARWSQQLLKNQRGEVVGRPGGWELELVSAATVKGKTGSAGMFADMAALVKRALGGRVAMAVGRLEQRAVKGGFVAPGLVLDAVSFADLCLNDPFVSKFLFCSEAKGAALAKTKFTFYYSTSRDIRGAPAVSLRPFSGRRGSPAGVSIKVSRVRSAREMEAVRNVLSRVLAYYAPKRQGILAEYEAVVGRGWPALYAASSKIREQKEQTKTGVRVGQLERFDRQLFPSRFPDQCQQHKQPYPLNAESAQWLAATRFAGQPDLAAGVASAARQDQEERGDAQPTDPAGGAGGHMAAFLRQHLFGGDAHKLLNFPSGSFAWFACQPRASAEEKQENVWPGLQKPGRQLLTASPDYPFSDVPCCFKLDQYGADGRGKGRLRTYLGGLAAKRSGGYMATTTKVLAPGGEGALPFYLDRLQEASGEQAGSKGLPFVRFGVHSGPGSFLHCMEQATDENYSTRAPPEELARAAARARDRLRALIGRSSKGYEAAREQLFADPRGQLLETLAEAGDLDPLVWCSLAERAYSCNLLLFSNSPEGGDVAFPAAYRALLRRGPDPTKKFVVLILTAAPGRWQAELVKKRKQARGGRPTFLFEGSEPFVRAMVRASAEAQQVSVVGPQGLIRLHPRLREARETGPAPRRAKGKEKKG